jgi:hypothetical protein
MVAVRLVSAWTNPVLKRVPGVRVLKRVPGVAQVLAVACGLAYRLGEKMKAGRCFVRNSFFDASKLIVVGSGLLL